MRSVITVVSLGLTILAVGGNVYSQSRDYAPYQVRRTRPNDQPQPLVHPEESGSEIQSAEWEVEDSPDSSDSENAASIEQAGYHEAHNWDHASSSGASGLMDPSGESPGYKLRYTLRHDIGDGLGYNDSFTRLGVFLPIWESGGQKLWFADLQPFVDNKGNFGANAGGGFRIYSYSLDRVFGAYAYFDYRETDHNRFRQGTVGFDSLGNNVDFRGNLYLPEESAQQIDPRFAGNLLLTGFEEAMPGADIEAGLVLPEVYGTQSRLLGGLYYFNTHEAEDAKGWRVRLESHWSSEISTDVVYNRDDYFGTTVTVGLQWNLQPTKFGIGNNVLPEIRSFRRGPLRHITRSAKDRLAEPTYRLPNIAVRRENGVALNPANGNAPFNFLHVVPGSTGGDGSIETPFGSLEDALSTASPHDIVYTPAGGGFNPFPAVPIPPGSFLVIPDEVRLLSNGPVQNITTTSDVLQLPGSGANVTLDALPSIAGSIQLGDGSELNGFQLTGFANQETAAGFIVADGKSDFIIANNNVDSLLDGIRITNGATNATITGNILNGALESGIDISGTDFSGTISNNVITDNTDDGITIALTGSFDGLISSNTISDGGGTTDQDNGINLQAGEIVAGSEISNNSFESNQLEGISIVVNGAGPSEINVFSNVFQDNNSGGREFFAQLNGGGAGLLTLNLGNNNSTNLVSATEFNYDLSKPTAGDTFTLTIPSANNGTIGASDGSTIP